MLIELILSFSCRSLSPLVFSLWDNCWLGLWLSSFFVLPHFNVPPPRPWCLDGTAFNIIYCTLKSLMSYDVCKSLLLVWAARLTWGVKQGALYDRWRQSSLNVYVRVKQVSKVNNRCTLHNTMKRSRQNCLRLLPFLKGNEKENKGILYIDPVLGLWA